MNCDVCGAVEHEPCEKCGQVVHVGEWPFCPHGQVQPRGGFEPHFDLALGEYVTGWGDVRQHMRRKGLDFRDHPSKSWIRERADKIRERQAREGAR